MEKWIKIRWEELVRRLNFPFCRIPLFNKHWFLILLFTILLLFSYHVSLSRLLFTDYFVGWLRCWCMKRYLALMLLKTAFPGCIFGGASVLPVVDAFRVSSLGHLFLDFPLWPWTWLIWKYQAPEIPNMNLSVKMLRYLPQVSFKITAKLGLWLAFYVLSPILPNLEGKVANNPIFPIPLFPREA